MLVTESLPACTQEQFRDLVVEQQARAVVAAQELRAGDGTGFYGEATARQAADILEKYGAGEFSAAGFIDGQGDVLVPMYLPVGARTLPEGVRGVSSLRVPIVGSDALDMRPNKPEHNVSRAALYAALGVNTGNVLFTNTGVTPNVRTVTSRDQLTNPTGHRLIVPNQEGNPEPLGTLIVRRPRELGVMAISGTNADNPIGLGAVINRETGELEAGIHFNGIWQNLQNGLTENTLAELERLGLRGPQYATYFGVGIGAIHGFEVSTDKVSGWNAAAVASSQEAQQHPSPAKCYLPLTHAVQLAVQSLANNPVEAVPLCTLDSARVNDGGGFAHSSRIHRDGPTPTGEQALGGRGLTIGLFGDV
ncbi:MAG TPA: hypothetical protein VLI54_02390 [Bacillota bacterium]|nr:hypothetical protein [Bacillota bacterium]